MICLSDACGAHGQILHNGAHGMLCKVFLPFYTLLGIIDVVLSVLEMHQISCAMPACRTWMTHLIGHVMKLDLAWCDMCIRAYLRGYTCWRLYVTSL